ncbi:1-phosphofructokinase family hexose kinase [Garciella nitratireducens]|uniref:Tagatose-6-phosphate kinase n=1 Tax=Garciella nitratireducens DSM 15102 TaxID=1121911 RepID=A0A1T4L2Z4_9FIRM|nr:1-phosphofructokinase family hexose kinase [Garciella nitratireducens]SJZ48941.1 tagatose 6-phosphate kinase [Garciella nitratireducens DSM 15102]
MITIVNLNPSIDKKYELSNIEKGKVIRARTVDNTAGGKGIHVANVATILGEDVLVTGFLGGKTGEFIEEKLNDHRIKNDFIKIQNPTRECLALITDDLTQTEILEPGPEVTEEEKAKFLKKYDELVQKSSIIVASGSTPKNISKDIYAKMICKASKVGKKFLLDTSGELLIKGIEAKPYLIKPNREELEMITGSYIVSEKDILMQIDKLNTIGIQCVIVSLGEEGSLVGYKGNKYRIQVPKIKAVNPVGSGDALVAGFAVGVKRGYSIKDTLILAAACGTANALEKETGFVRKEVVEKIIQEIKVDKI